MNNTCNMSNKINKLYNDYEEPRSKTDHHSKYNKKKAQRKHAMVEKRKPLPPKMDNVPPYQDESKKVVDSAPRSIRKPTHEIKRLYYSPANCNCCWSKDNKWYRRHHRVIKKKGDNKDKKSGHWMRRSLIRPPSYVSKYVVRQEITEGISNYYE